MNEARWRGDAFACRNYAESTIRTYIRTVEHFSDYFRRSPDQLGPEHIRQYQALLFTRWKLGPNTVTQRLAALRFFTVHVLKRGWSVAEMPYPKKVLHLPQILSPEEVARLIDAAELPFHRILLMTLYATGARRAEVAHLKISDIDSQRMVIHIRGGKGGNHRDVMLSPKLLDALRVYWRGLRRKTTNWLFPGNRWHTANYPASTKVLWTACQRAAQRAGLEDKLIHPHTLRHCFATQCWKLVSTCGTIQMLLGHRDLEETTIYLHLSRRHLSATCSPHVFRGKFVAALKTAFRNGTVEFHGQLAPLAEPRAFASWLKLLFRKDWVVYSEPPFGGPEHVLRYLGAYTHRIAISNHRLLALADGCIRFRWRESAHNNRKRIMTLPVDEFLRRFLLHLLPCRFMRIRNFGFLANRRRAELLPLCFRLLQPSDRPPARPASPAALSASSLWTVRSVAESCRVVERPSATQLLLRSPPHPGQCAA